MNCRDLIHFLMEYLSGDLSPTERRQFEEHMAECPDCVAYLATYQEAIRQGKAVCAEDWEAISAEVPEDLIQAITSGESWKCPPIVADRAG